jgi:hypothetical protein
MSVSPDHDQGKRTKAAQTEGERGTMNEQRSIDEVRRSRQSMLRVRWVLVALSAVLAVALIANGAVVIGGIIAAMAIVRAVMITRWQRHGHPFATRRQ